MQDIICYLPRCELAGSLQGECGVGSGARNWIRILWYGMWVAEAATQPVAPFPALTVTYLVTCNLGR